MPYTMNDQEYVAVLGLPGGKRCEHFVKRIADWEEVWTLKSKDGFLIAGDDAGHELIPVWPHPRYAAACASGHWHGAEPECIGLHEWIERWIPGMERDGRWVAVFPTPDNKGVAVQSSRLSEDLEAELGQNE